MFERGLKRQMGRDPKFEAKIHALAAKRAARKHGPGAKQTLNLRQDYAVALHRSGEYEMAEAELADVIARRQLTADAADDGLQHARSWHAQVLLDMGRFEDAEREWRALSEERERLFGARSSGYARCA
jgi:hypothetical protein